MPTDIANFIARSGAFRAPDLAGVDQARYSNALARNQVDRLPQQNREQDLAIQGQEQALSANQVNNAKGILGRQLVMIGTSRSPKQTAMQITASPDFQAAASFLKLPPIQITPDDTDELIGSQAMQLAQALGVGPNVNQAKPSALVEQYELARSQGFNGSLLDFAGQLSQNQVGAQYGAPTQVGGATIAPSRVDPSRNVVLAPAQQEIDFAAEKAGAEAWARAAATAGVDLQKEQGTREGTLGVWRVARQGLLAGLSGTTTGPIAGRLPAVTSGQQIAEGAIAAVAPVLKQLFRSAGEGVFTDRDQELLIAMIPNRNDHRETIASKMQMIDAIIEAKLSAPSPLPQAPGTPATSVPSSNNDPLGIR